MAEATTVWALPRSLAATDGITDLFSLPRGTEMVHFPRFALPSYVFRRQYMSSAHVGSPIRKSTGQRMLAPQERKSTRLNSSHRCISYAVFCLQKKNQRIVIDHDAAGNGAGNSPAGDGDAADGLGAVVVRDELNELANGEDARVDAHACDDDVQ